MNPIWLHSDFIDSYSQFIIRTLLPLKDRCGLGTSTLSENRITLEFLFSFGVMQNFRSNGQPLNSGLEKNALHV